MALVPRSLPLSLWGLVITPKTALGVSPPDLTPAEVGRAGPPRCVGRGEQKMQMGCLGAGVGGAAGALLAPERVIRSDGATQEPGQGRGGGAWTPRPCPEELSSDAGLWGRLEHQSSECGGRAGAPGGGSHGGRGRGLATQALDDVGSLNAAQGRQEGVERRAVLGGPAGKQGSDGAGLVGEGVYVLRLVAQLTGQVSPGVPRRAVEQLLHLLPLGWWQTAVETSIPLEGCQEPGGHQRRPATPPAPYSGLGGPWAKTQEGLRISPPWSGEGGGSPTQGLEAEVLDGGQGRRGVWGADSPPLLPIASALPLPSHPAPPTPSPQATGQDGRAEEGHHSVPDSTTASVLELGSGPLIRAHH